jgi:hypothetical protein
MPTFLTTARCASPILGNEGRSFVHGFSLRSTCSIPSTPKFDELGQSLAPDGLYAPECQLKVVEREQVGIERGP